MENTQQINGVNIGGLKLRVYKKHVAQTLNWYQEKLTGHFGPRILSEAQREIMRREFEQIHKKTMKLEKTNSWQVPLQIEFRSDGSYQVLPLDESRLLYLDD